MRFCASLISVCICFKLLANRLDSTDRKVDVYYPSNGVKGKSFPLISYAHGDHGGGDLNHLGYWSQLHALASYGFVVAATRSCSSGCRDNPKSLPGDARRFGTCQCFTFLKSCVNARVQFTYDLHITRILTHKRSRLSRAN